MGNKNSNELTVIDHLKEVCNVNDRQALSLYIHYLT